MDATTLPLILVFLFCLALSAYMAASETAFSMANRIRLKNYADHGNKGALRALYLTDEGMDKMLVTVLIITNIAHTAGASIATVFATRIWGMGAVTICTAVTTIIIFIIGESLPKNYAASHADNFSMKNAFVMTFLVKVFTPLSLMFSFVKKVVGKIIKTDDEPTVNEEELHDIIENIDEESGFEKEKSELLQSALEFDETTVQDILTPRIDIVGIDEDMTPSEIINLIKNVKYSRIPVYRNTLDNILGTVSIRKYIKKYLKYKDDTYLSDILEKPFYVYKTMPIDEILREMSAKKIHMAFVKDEYGGTSGLITVEDVLEELVGEIWDEDDEVREDFVPIGGNRYEVSADMQTDDAFELMGYKDYKAEDFEHKKVGAWVLEQFDAMPKENDSFMFGKIYVKILETSPTRIIKVMMQLKEDEA